MGYLFAGGFTAPSGSSSICETEMDTALLPGGVLWQSPAQLRQKYSGETPEDQRADKVLVIS